ncbi:hypothetical protein [Pedobacter sp. Leaf132]|uniref:glycosyltransferase family protein n=1 Tax=Pedobacter sp. Leaf132 TaxID=2876557 RepID=UPI001E307248|nr:hypothetical protein [Pedobacter sp. Leaf132]
MIKKICLITPSHISSNPRLIKEAKALVSLNYAVHIIFAQTLNYLIIEDEKILKNNPDLTYQIISNKNIFQKTLLKTLGVISKHIDKFYLINYQVNYSCSLFLDCAIKFDADIYIAHNLAALPVAVNAAKINKAKCGFDAEDFHRNELSNDPSIHDVKIKTFIEDKYLKQLDYITAASPLIAKAYKNIYPKLKPVVINNVFELIHQPPVNLNENEGLKLFWFSQTIGKNRGLEDVIEAINIINDAKIELHLLGNLSTEDLTYFNSLAKFPVNYYEPISGDDIFKFAAKFDIGLALEPGFCLNNEIALSNKLFTHLISGLAIIASNTQAQQQFLEKNAFVGRLYPIANVAELAKIIIQFLNNKDLLNDYKKNAYELAKSKYNWESESKKFLTVVEQTLAT